MTHKPESPNERLARWLTEFSDPSVDEQQHIEWQRQRIHERMEKLIEEAMERQQLARLAQPTTSVETDQTTSVAPARSWWQSISDWIAPVMALPSSQPLAHVRQGNNPTNTPSNPHGLQFDLVSGSVRTQALLDVFNEHNEEIPTCPADQHHLAHRVVCAPGDECSVRLKCVPALGWMFTVTIGTDESRILQHTEPDSVPTSVLSISVKAMEQPTTLLILWSHSVNALEDTYDLLLESPSLKIALTQLVEQQKQYKATLPKDAENGDLQMIAIDFVSSVESA